MPLLSIAVDDGIWQTQKEAILTALPRIRDMLCTKLSVGQEFSHLTVAPVFCPQDQTLVNGDLRILGKDGRGQDVLEDVAATLQSMLAEATGTHSSVRISTMDSARYLAKR